MATTSDVRQLNRAAVLKSVRRRQIARRADVASDSGMSLATVTRIVDDLVSEGLILLEEPEQRSPLGRPTRQLTLDGSIPRNLLAEIGPRWTRLFVTGAKSADVPIQSVEFRTPNDASAWATSLADSLNRLALPDTVNWVVVSVPGVVDEAQGRVLLSPNLHWSESFDFEAIFRAGSQRRVRIIHETRALALGHFERNPSSRSFLLADIGTGVGSSALIDGESFQGSLPLSGEIGHTRIPGHAEPCGCGGRGCLEAVIGRRAVLARQGTDDIADLAKVIENNGLPRWFEERIDACGAVLAGALNVLGLDRLIVTGYFEELPDVAFERLVEATVTGTMWARFGKLRITTAPRQRLAGLSASAFDAMLSGDF